MSNLKSGDFERFLQTGLSKTRLVLVYGPDEGLVRTRISRLSQALLGKQADDLSLADLEADTLNADPARLMDEANAISMFGGERVILVRHAGKLAKPIWQAAFTASGLGTTILFHGDDLAKTSPLRNAAEAANHCVCIPCYPASLDETMDRVEARCKAAGLSLTPVARSYLASLLGADFALSEQEIDKVLLYCTGNLTIDLEDIEAVISDTSETGGSEPVDLAFEGAMEEIESIALRTFREGTSPAGVLTIALNHAFLLQRLVLAHESGNLDSVIRQERIFFKRQARIRKQAQSWSTKLLNRSIEALSAAQQQGRHLASLEETIAIRALWSIALAARRGK
jgi:DNA polymerase III subunit delta